MQLNKLKRSFNKLIDHFFVQHKLIDLNKRRTMLNQKKNMTGTRPDINGAATDRKRHKRTEFPVTWRNQRERYSQTLIATALTASKNPLTNFFAKNHILNPQAHPTSPHRQHEEKSTTDDAIIRKEKTGDYCLPFTMLKPLRLFNPLPVKSNGTGLGISPPKRRPSNKPKDQSPN